MVKNIKIYLDTSVMSALFDNRNPDRQDLTKNFFEKIEKFEIYISELVLAEISDIKNEELKQKVRNMITDYNIIQINEEMRRLSNEYIKYDAIPSSFPEDSLHIAIATLNNIDYLLSWNFRHIVKIKTRKIINMVNLSLGYPELKIITPAELI